jgi:hypothetical protein
MPLPAMTAQIAGGTAASKKIAPNAALTAVAATSALSPNHIRCRGPIMTGTAISIRIIRKMKDPANPAAANAASAVAAVRSQSQNRKKTRMCRIMSHSS